MINIPANNERLVQDVMKAAECPSCSSQVLASVRPVKFHGRFHPVSAMFVGHFCACSRIWSTEPQREVNAETYGVAIKFLG